MLKIGVIGAGHLGKIHIRCIKNIEEFELVGFYDIDPNVSDSVAEEFQVKSFKNFEDLLESVDVVDIVTPTTSHYEYAVKALKKCKHLFIEKPIVTNLEEAKSLLKISEEANVKIQVGHIERFNPAFLSIENYIDKPMFIEAHRLSFFQPRGIDVSVVFDLMIHDIDMILHISKAKVKNVHAIGVAIVSDKIDIANARIEFDNGCIANLTASRISLKNMRKTRIFQRNTYIAIDYLEKYSEIIQLKDLDSEKQITDQLIFQLPNNLKKGIIRINPPVPQVNSIEMELRSFARSIIEQTDPVVSIYDGYNALEVAHLVTEKINNHLQVYY